MQNSENTTGKIVYEIQNSCIIIVLRVYNYVNCA